MDPKQFEQLMQKAAPQAQPEAVAPEPQLDPAALEQMAGELLGGGSPEADIPAGPMAGLMAGAKSLQEPNPLEALGGGGMQPSDAAAVSGGSEMLSSAVGGGLKAVFETKDFLFGDTPRERQGDFRKQVEEKTDALTEESILNGFAAGVGQFAVAMVGLGKLSKLAKAAPVVGKAISSASSAIGSTFKGKVALEAGQAALAGAIAFDPHEERLSNLVQGTPLANPVTDWLAADPEDSEALGRLKTALESIGMDATIIGTFLGSGKILKYLRKGDQQAASKAVDELEAEQRANVEAEQNAAAEPAAPEPLPTEAGGAEPIVPPQADPMAGQAVPPGADTLGNGPEAPLPVSGAEGGPEVPLPVGSGPELPAPGGTVDVSVTKSPATAAAEDGVNPKTGLPTRESKAVIQFSDEDTLRVVADVEADINAIETHGGWYQAIQAGHVFGKGEGIPYHKLTTDAEVDDFIARAVDAKVEQLDSLKGGDVMSDAKVDRMVQQRVKLTGEDPAVLLGMIQQSGRMAPALVANMEVGFSLSQKAFMDAWSLNARMRLGDYTEFGSKAAMEGEIKRRLSLAISMYGSAKSISSNAGRTMRRMRREFMFDPAIFDTLDGQQLSDVLDASGANPRSFRHLASPSTWKVLGDFVMAMRINNLVSGPLTQLINVTTSGAMTGIRPLERIIGASIRSAAGDVQSRAIVRESIKQYTYMGSALVDGFTTAVKAFTRNDSVLVPHTNEVNQMNRAAGQQAFNGQFFKPWDSTPNLLYNVLSVAGAPLGLPTRTLGSVDELIKQITYRSKVMAKAHMEAAELIAGQPLSPASKKQAVKSYVETRLANAFDDAGRGTDPEALKEALLATFQQDLIPGTLGKTIQTATSNYWPMKLVIPFVKTPTNVIRYGWKLTPGLNLLQTEYRDMLLGSMGREAQVQASGQMTLGATFLGAAAYMASQGRITGGGPKDPKLKAELMATGWKPYSVVVENDDGTKSYYSYGRLDPVAIPFGIIADLQDAKHILEDDPENQDIARAIGGLSIALAKQFTSKSYLLGVSQTLEAMQDPDRRGMNMAGSMAQSFIPFSSATRQLSGDDYMREARDLTDKVLQVIPGMSETLPAKYNWLGEPVVSRPGLWSTDNGSLVDTEMQRLALESGAALTKVNPSTNGVDLRDVTMADGRNAYEAYQKLSGRPTPRTRPLRDVMANVIKSEAYRKAPDGEVTTKGTKLWILAKYASKYREAAMKQLKKDPKVREAFMTEDQKVREHYRQFRGLTDTSSKPSGLGAVGKAFGTNTGQ